MNVITVTPTDLARHTAQILRLATAGTWVQVRRADGTVIELRCREVAFNER